MSNRITVADPHRLRPRHAGVPVVARVTHKEATALARRSACLLCGATGSAVPAHFPHHRRRRTFPDVWDVRNWVPLCGQPGACHDLIDSRAGGQMDDDCAARELAREKVLGRAREWWPA